MAATIYTAPEGLDAPDFDTFHKDGRYDTTGYMEACKEHEAAVIAWAKENGSGDLCGKVFRYGVADGNASYVIFKNRPLSMIHLDHMDGYHIPELVRAGLTVATIRPYLDQSERIASIFGGKS